MSDSRLRSAEIEWAIPLDNMDDQWVAEELKTVFEEDIELPVECSVAGDELVVDLSACDVQSGDEGVVLSVPIDEGEDRAYDLLDELGVGFDTGMWMKQEGKKEREWCLDFSLEGSSIRME